MLSEDESAKKSKELKDNFKLFMDYEPLTVTCQACPINDECVFAWDAYNTNGDCLADK